MLVSEAATGVHVSMFDGIHTYTRPGLRLSHELTKRCFMQQANEISV